MGKSKTYTAKKKRWHQRRYTNRLNNGLCPQCGGERTGKWITCEACREKSNARRKTRTLEANRKTINKYRARCRKQGICYGCGSYIGLGEYKRCEACREKDRKAHMARYIQEALTKPSPHPLSSTSKGITPTDRQYYLVQHQDIQYRASSPKAQHLIETPPDNN